MSDQGQRSTPPVVRLAELLDVLDTAKRGHLYNGYPRGARTILLSDVENAERRLGRFMADHGRKILEVLDADE